MRKCQLRIILLILISQSYTITHFGISGARTEKPSCLDNEYLGKKGFCCDKCHPGFKLKAECPEPKKRSECVKCDNGTYLERSNYNPNCFSCQTCKKPHMKEISPCTPDTNRVCGCDQGYYKRKLSESVWECSPCRKDCGPGQFKTSECNGEQNTNCTCKENHYPEGKTSCKPCVECGKWCKHLCITSSPAIPVKSPQSPSGTLPQILVPVCACITVVALGVFMLYEGIRLQRKRNRALSPQSSSAAPQDQTFIITVPSDKINESDPFTNQPCEPEQHRKLPDCIPREIKIHEFFYFVLDEVPIGRFKELARRLGVSEQNIDRAEQDHRNCKDAHYQMLKVWSDSGSGGGNNVLPYHRIQMFIETLKDMYLANCADNIENRFLSQDTSSS
ncbi:tumor necrosis factor receptor superfamily member 1A [Rhinichthys klamathensis goyatoka]|uniref:tumor necrosis factor receptor superfamily member 1A n=1 Tax=Rhinichthys klamathensis goyatoka TaxID=3034132 RepID=UPI0024B5BCFC|nr:tumor necrosis factor receptor superfamily member 1A [Rhinichthys klamathensis goyatoka]XP_056090869.1 tumor necrosis factor receptor superfamily member 1A [Rhinichthys klamathensis goyatoka]